MRKLIALAALMLPATISAQQAEIGVYHQSLFVRDSGSVTNFDFVQGYVYFTKKAGVWGFAYREPGYFSTTAGIYYDIKEWFEIGLAGGFERFDSKTHLRLAGTAWVGNEKLSLEIYYENGSTGEGWYQGNLMYRPNKHYGLGLLSQKGAGTGPRILIRPIDRLPLEVWIAPVMYEQDRGSLNALFGAQIVLQKH